ncbi:hypothetical protein EBS57_04965, partial [bacterium]|nr:hypothetical protein [bacterium]
MDERLILNDAGRGGNVGGAGNSWREAVGGAQDKGMKRGIAGILAFFSLWALLTSVLAWPVALVVEAAAPGVFPFARVFGRVELGVALALAAGLLRFWGEDPRPWVDGRGWRKELG